MLKLRQRKCSKNTPHSEGQGTLGKGTSKSIAKRVTFNEEQSKPTVHSLEGQSVPHQGASVTDEYHHQTTIISDLRPQSVASCVVSWRTEFPASASYGD